MKWTLAVIGLGLGIGSLAQNEVVTEYASTVTVGFSPSSTTGSAAAVNINAAISTSASSQPTTLSTVKKVATSSAAAQSTTPPDNSQGAGGYDPPTSGTDTAAGASGGDSSSFQLGQGALIAIIVVCVVVVIIGVASTVLFVVAKRRQWDVRASIARASRRVTGRFGAGKQTKRPDRRNGMHSKAFPMEEAKLGHKRGLVVDVKPVASRKDPLRGKAPENTRPREQTWIKGLWGGGWK